MLLLIILLSALIIGYQIKTALISDIIINRVMLLLVTLILFVMGYEFGVNANNLFAELVQIMKIVMVFSSFIFVSNFVLISILLKKQNMTLQDSKHKVVTANYLEVILSSAKYILMIVFGIVCGNLLHYQLSYFETIINGLLIFLLFIIGYQLRANGIPLKHVFFNKLGVYLSVIVVVSSLIAGAFAGMCLGIPVSSSLAMSSGFGWYTLSSILVGNLVGGNYGTAAFFIDFSRELVAIILLPSIGRFFPVSMVGYCGATALDFSLPIIKQNLHEKNIVIAISSGMILSILVPILIPLFAKI